MTFQVFQLIAHVVRDPAIGGEKFFVICDRVAIKGEGVRGVSLFVQNFVRSRHFTQRSVFSESRLTMLSDSVANAVSFTSSPVFAPWSIKEKACAGQVITDLRFCWDLVILRRCTAKGTTERRFHGCTPSSETASRPGLRSSNVLEEGPVEFVPFASPALGPPRPSKIRSSPRNRKKTNLLEPLEIAAEF